MGKQAIEIVAFIGAGIMGAAIVRRFLGAGFRVRVWNRTEEKLRPLVNLGAEWAASPAAAADGADIVCLCVADRSAVETVIFGELGVCSVAQPPALLVDFSTIGPGATKDFAARLQAACGTSWVDAPVSGGVIGAESGRLVVFCGGKPEDIEYLAPVFAACAQRTTRTGEIGAGQALKLCNQLVVASNLVAIAELMSLAQASGLELAQVPQALAGGFADSIPLQIFGRRMAEGVRSPVLGELSLMLKDLTMVEDLMRQYGRDLPLTRAALEVYRRAAREGLSHEDLAALSTLYLGSRHPRASDS